MAEPAQRYTTAEPKARFPQDERLRAHGYTIWSRPGKGESIWLRGGKLYTWSEALAEIRKERQ